MTDPTETQNFLHILVYLCTFGVPILMALTWLGTESHLRGLSTPDRPSTTTDGG